ncbi:cytochrome P450 [Xylariales sp. PMI_506]|nr:cytochrome P450 [Xylariales sp. PMI_506]
MAQDTIPIALPYFSGNAASPSWIFWGVLSLYGAYLIGNAIYSVTLHPLAKFPGPKIAAVTWLLKLHAEYGTTVRFAPNDLSYSEPRAWKEVQGRKENGKAKEIIPPPLNGTEPIIIADPEPHSRVRQLFLPAFSDRALRKQEPLLQEHAGLMVAKAHKLQEIGQPVDMVKLFNCTTFDIMSHMCFGKSLGLLESEDYTPWVKDVFRSVKIIPLVQIIEYYPLLQMIFHFLEPQSLKDMKNAHFKHSSDLVDERLSRGSDQPDIWNLITTAKDGGGLTLGEMHTNADFFMVAGTETAATAISGLCYHLLVNPDKMTALTNEIRDSFASSKDITISRLANLKYLNACLQETLRVYPPVPNGVPRVVPKGGQVILDKWVPGNVRVSCHHSATYLDPSNFANPHEFAPERWLDDCGSEYKQDKRDALHPFSLGPRNCLGQNLAWQEMRLLAAKLLMDFDLELCEESRNWADQKVYSLWEKGPLMCRLKSRVE